MVVTLFFMLKSSDSGGDIACTDTDSVNCGVLGALVVLVNGLCQ